MNRNGPILTVTPRRKKHRGLKIFLGIVAVILVAGAILFALNYRTILLFTGRGAVRVPDSNSLANSLKSNSRYENVQTSSGASGETVVTAQSKDGAVTVKSTTDASGEQTVEVQMDVTKMQGVSTSRSLSNLQAIQSHVNEYLVSAVDSSQLTGIESYVAREALAQYQSGQSTFSVSHNFSGTQLDATGSFETGKVQIHVARSTSSGK